MSQFAYEPGDPREEEWAERITSALADVMIESMPDFEQIPAVVRATQDPHGSDVLHSTMQEALLNQLYSLIDDAASRVVEHIRSTAPVAA